MPPIITAFRHPPDGGRALMRDMRVRWALEEVGQSYSLRLLSYRDMKRPEHRALNPFGLIPTFEQDGFVLFESGAIVLHVAESYPGLLPQEGPARARAIAWLFAALNTVEAAISGGSVDAVRHRLAEISAHLGESDWLDGVFSVADLMVVSVLRVLGSSGLLEERPNLASYVRRGEARPASLRAKDRLLAGS